MTVTPVYISHDNKYNILNIYTSSCQTYKCLGCSMNHSLFNSSFTMEELELKIKLLEIHQIIIYTGSGNMAFVYFNIPHTINDVYDILKAVFDYLSGLDSPPFTCMRYKRCRHINPALIDI